MSLRSLLYSTLAFISLTSAQAQVFVAVIEFQGKGVSTIEASALTDRLILELFQTNHFRVMEREMLDRILTEQELQTSGCTSTECLVEIGQLAGVEQVISGSISKIGNVYSISARLISVESGEILDVAYFDYKGEMGELLTNGMGQVARQLITKETVAVDAESLVMDDQTPRKEIPTDQRFVSLSPRVGVVVGDLVPVAYGGSLSFKFSPKSAVGIDVGYAHRLDTERMERNEFETMSVYLTYEYEILQALALEIAAGYHDGYYDSFVSIQNHDVFDYSGFGARLGVLSHIPREASRLGLSPRAYVELGMGADFYFALNLALSADIRFFR